MKCVLLMCMLVAAVWADEKYTDKYDDINIGEVVGNKKILSNYYKCLMDVGPCTPDAKELKGHMTDGLKTGCAKCTDKQKQGVKQVIDHLIKNDIEKWNALCAKYDPEGTWRQKYEAEAKANGIEIPKK